MRKLASEIITDLHRDIPTGETEFEYLHNAFVKDGQIMGIDRFLKDIEKIANL